jgi:hypothetical protein
VQAAHAAMEAGKSFSPDPHPNFCLCTVENEAELRFHLDRLVKEGIRICAWYEPDRNNELTAIASEPISGERRRLFREFKLLKGPEKEVCT